jgi:hypothetical protein
VTGVPADAAHVSRHEVEASVSESILLTKISPRPSRHAWRLRASRLMTRRKPAAFSR